MSKLKAGDVTMWATTTLMDLVGPYAQTTDCPLEKWFRDAKIYQLFEGTAQVQRLVIARMQRRSTGAYGRRGRGADQAPGAATGDPVPVGSDPAVASHRAPARHNYGVGFTFDPGVIAVLVLAEALYVRAWRVLRAAATRSRAASGRVARGVAGHGGRRCCRPIGGLSDQLLVAHMGEHLMLADLACAATAGGHPLAGLRLSDPRAGAQAPGPPQAPARRLSQAAPAAGGHPALDRDPVRLALHVPVRERHPSRLGACAPAPELHRGVAAGVVVGHRAQEAPPAGATCGRCPTSSARGCRECSWAWASSSCGSVAYADPYAVTAPEHGWSALTDQQVAGGHDDRRRTWP